MKIFKLVFIVLSILFIVPDIFAVTPEIEASMVFDRKFIFWSFLLGGLSAISLVIGSILGIFWNPKPKITAAFTAFGAGALLAALSVELIAPTVMEFVENSHSSGANDIGHDKFIEFISLLVGCIIGGLLFYFLNEILNSSGGYLRKVSTTLSHFNHLHGLRYKRMIKRLSKIKLFRLIPSSHLDILVQHIKYVHIKKGRYLFHPGEKLKKIFIIESGEVESSYGEGSKEILKQGNVLGERSFLSHDPVDYEAMALTDLKVFEISDHDFMFLHESCPELQEILETESKHELMHDLGHENGSSPNHIHAEGWTDRASDLVHHTYIPNQNEINETAKQHSSAPLAIWLGIFLDGIPESFVIGAGFLLILASKGATVMVSFFDVIPYTLIAGLFLSNLPEAMSSTIGMKKMNWKISRILLLWTSLLVMTATGSVVGYHFGSVLPNYLQIGIEGVASGAMLTMIAQTMIPEAVHIGGSKVTGLSTLAGYLSAVAFKIFE